MPPIRKGGRPSSACSLLFVARANIDPTALSGVQGSLDDIIEAIAARKAEEEITADMTPEEKRILDGGERAAPR